jgi:hypothetical protein
MNDNLFRIRKIMPVEQYKSLEKELKIIGHETLGKIISEKFSVVTALEVPITKQNLSAKPEIELCITFNLHEKFKVALDALQGIGETDMDLQTIKSVANDALKTIKGIL